MNRQQESIPPTLKINKTGPITTKDRFFQSIECGRTLMLRGVNLSGSVKQPYTPLLPSHEPSNFFDGENVSFVGRPFPLAEADEHFARLKLWGFNFLRFNITWEALEHAGPGKYDYDYINYVVQILLKAKEYGFRAFIDPHQDVWSRFTGGSGAPKWTLQLAGFEPENLNACHAALVQNTFSDPSQFPKMIWPTNYWKLAVATMFTLFFAGKTFAPKCKVGDENIQDFLQRHYRNAVCELAKAIAASDVLLDDVVVGYDTLNEPGSGWIGVEDITQLAKEQELRKGLTPTPFQAMMMGEGLEVADVQVWDMTSVGPQKMSTRTVSSDGVRAWKSSTSCIWAQHGVWNIDDRTCEKPHYFSSHPATGEHVDFLVHFWKPFVNDFSNAVRSVHRKAIMFVEPPVNAMPPTWTQNDTPGPICFAPHWYDGITLINKQWSSLMTVDYIGFLRGKYMSLAFAVKFGESAIKNCFKSQLQTLRLEGEEFIGNQKLIQGKYPTVIGEIGIPYDMNGKAAYHTGDYTSQIQAMDANMCGLERDLLNYTIWNYCSDNCHHWGDNWNGEDLSIWSRPVAKKLMRDSTGAVESPKDLNEGGRAVQAFVRPYPIHTPGIPRSIRFDLSEKSFIFTFTHNINANGTWNFKEDGIIIPHTEIFLPNIHFPSEEDIEVLIDSGIYSVFIKEQRVLWQCDCASRAAGASSNGSVNSVGSTAGLTKRKISDETITHKIVIRKRSNTSKPIDQVTDEDEDAGICPQCSVM
ncbi:hypothetical protein HDV04_005420 [Boothiomyces sp. JEL0838]|nr:hypothetical protein HDV04_005420 [Boothiomyces sp. JEL0838]